MDSAKAPVRILHLDDNPADARFLELTRVEEAPSVAYSFTPVVEKGASIAALEREEFDVILSDYRMSGYNGDEALIDTKRLCPETPFIMVTGELGEDRAIETLHRGATDYVLKDNLKRLVPSIHRALEEAEIIRQRRQAEAKLRETVEELAAANEALRRDRQTFVDLVDGSPFGTYIIDAHFNDVTELIPDLGDGMESAKNRAIRAACLESYESGRGRMPVCPGVGLEFPDTQSRDNPVFERLPVQRDHPVFHAQPVHFHP